MSFAIFEDGSRQYRVSVGDVLEVDYRAGAEAGSSLTFENVLLANGGGDSLIGAPSLGGAKVTAEIVNPLFKGPKLEIQKHRRRHNSKRHTGHRQKHTQIKITAIDVPNLQIKESNA